jgi:hypothetical protein
VNLLIRIILGSIIALLISLIAAPHSIWSESSKGRQLLPPRAQDKPRIIFRSSQIEASRRHLAVWARTPNCQQTISVRDLLSPLTSPGPPSPAACRYPSHTSGRLGYHGCCRAESRADSPQSGRSGLSPSWRAYDLSYQAAVLNNWLYTILLLLWHLLKKFALKLERCRLSLTRLELMATTFKLLSNRSLCSPASFSQGI